MTFPGYIRGLRLGSDGPALYGTNAGDVPVWDPATGWGTGPVPAPPTPAGLTRVVSNAAALEGISLATATPVVLELDGQPGVWFTVQMADPLPTRQYWAVFATTVIQNQGFARMSASWSYNNGGGWDNDTVFTEFVGSALATQNSPWQLWMATPVRLGSQLGSGAMPATPPSLTVRIIIEEVSGVVSVPDTAWGQLQLFEVSV